MLDAGKGGPHIGSAILRGGGNSQGKQKESKTVSHFKPPTETGHNPDLDYGTEPTWLLASVESTQDEVGT
jgi:hypothetical protein